MADYKNYVKQAEQVSSLLNGPSKLDPKWLESLWAASEGGDPAERVERATNQVVAALERGDAVEAGASGGGGGKPKKDKKSKKDRGKQDSFDTAFDGGQMAPPTPGHGFNTVPVGVPMGVPMSAAPGAPMGTPQNMMHPQMQQQPQMQPYGHEMHMHQQQVPPPLPPMQTTNTFSVDTQIQNTANELADIEKQIDQLKGSQVPGTMLQAGFPTPGSGFGASGFPGGSGLVGANACGGGPFNTTPCGGGSFGAEEDSDSNSDNDWWHQPPPAGNTFGTAGGLDSSNGPLGAGGFPGTPGGAPGFGGPQPAQQSFSQW